jgi:hypothetical protein
MTPFLFIGSLVMLVWFLREGWRWSNPKARLERLWRRRGL